MLSPAVTLRTVVVAPCEDSSSEGGQYCSSCKHTKPPDQFSGNTAATNNLYSELQLSPLHPCSPLHSGSATGLNDCPLPAAGLFSASVVSSGMRDPCPKSCGEQPVCCPPVVPLLAPLSSLVPLVLSHPLILPNPLVTLEYPLVRAVPLSILWFALYP